MSENNPHISGRYVIIGALISGVITLVATFGNTAYEHYLNKPKAKPQEYYEAEKLCLDFLNFWSEKNLKRMEELLHPSFYYEVQVVNYQSRKQFIEEKKDIFKKRKWIKVKPSKLEVSFFDETYQKGVIQYEQYYETPTYKSRGINKLHFEKYKGEYKITVEEFHKQ